MIHANKNTTTGLKFEEEITIHKDGQDLIKNSFYF